MAVGVRPLQSPLQLHQHAGRGQRRNLNAKYDVIIFAPVGRANPQQIVSGMPMFGNPLPWKKSELTPNLGGIDETDDMRPGLGWGGLQNLQNFARRGGLLDHGGRYVEFRGHVRIHARRFNRAAAEVARHGQRVALEDDRRRKPHRLRLQR